MANNRLNATITIGGAISAGLRSAIGSAVSGINQIGSAVSQLTTRQRDLGRVVSQQERLGGAGSALRIQYAQQEMAMIERQIAGYNRLQGAMRRNQNAITANQEARAGYRGKIGETVGLAIGAAAPIIAAARFEKAMLGVAKQVNGARDANGNLTATYYDMGKAIQQMGREIPIATNDLADMVTAGARMGIAKEDLLGFTRNAAMMSVAFELPAAELADSMGKIAGIFKLPIKNIGDLGDAINYLDDNAISKGGDIIKVMQGDLAGAASTMGLSAKNAAALASTFLTLGESAERADTAASGMLRELNNAKMNPKRFQVGLKMIGMSGDQLQKGMINDAQGTILKVLDTIKNLPKEKQMEAVTRLFGKDWGGAVAKLAGGVEEYRRQIGLANGEAAKGSMGREFSATLATTSAQWVIMKNRVVEVAVNLGTVLLPAVNRVMSVIGDITSRMAEWAQAHPRVTQAVVGTVVALTSLKVAAWAAGYAWTYVKGAALLAQGAVLRFNAVMMIYRTGMLASTIATTALGAALMATPIGWIIAGIAAIVAGAVLIWKYWEPLKAFFVGFGQGVVAAFAPLGQALSDAFSPIWKVIGPVVMPILATVGGWIKSAIGWFMDLFTPIDKASSTTAAFGEAGQVCGKVVGEAFRVMLAPIELVVNAIKWVNDNIGGVIDKASRVGSAISGGWQSAKEYMTGDAAPSLPAMRGAGAGAAGGTQQTNTFNITQQPGENSEEFARRLADILQRQQATQQRSRMTDDTQ